MTILNEETKQFLSAVGGLAEILSYFRNQCIENGFTRAEALSLCKTYLLATLNSSQHKSEEQE